MGLVEMDDKQFDELILTIINSAEAINNSIKSLESTIKDMKINTVDTPKDKEYNMDLEGIPLSSVHHPNNPELIADKAYHWDDKVKMWRR